MKTIKTLVAIAIIFTFSCSKETLKSPSVNAQAVDNSTTQTAGHYIGERFGGGIIFYLSKDSLHGVIADSVDLPPAVWWNGTYTATGVVGTRLGIGKTNTRNIISAQGQTGLHYAALECAKSKRGGYTDWFLPSKDELNELYKQKDMVGGFDYDFYWSSSEDYRYYIDVWIQIFYNGDQDVNTKDGTGKVRAVRTF